jgi:hypothetical protein
MKFVTYFLPLKATPNPYFEFLIIANNQTQSQSYVMSVLVSSPHLGSKTRFFVTVSQLRVC